MTLFRQYLLNSVIHSNKNIVTDFKAIENLLDYVLFEN